MRSWRSVFLVVGLLLTYSQSVQSQPDAAPPVISTADYERLQSMVVNNRQFQEGFSGFSLFDLERKEYLYDYRGSMHFVPASNVKILTFYLAANLLAEGAPAVFYERAGDTLRLWGTGYPILLHPAFSEQDTLFKWLQTHEGPIELSFEHYESDRYGAGWSWDDYRYGYQVEQAALPLYGNVVRFLKKGRYGKIRAIPDRFEQRLVYRPDLVDQPSISRAENLNYFTYNNAAVRSGSFMVRTPYVYSKELATELLADTLHKEVTLTDRPLPKRGQYEVLRFRMTKGMYQRLLQKSDNFIAEQLLLMCAAQRYGRIDTKQILKYGRDTMLRYLAEPIQWYDGSGLSRYNQMTPNTIIQILNQLYAIVPRETLLNVFSVGGRNGTLRSRFGGTRSPYVFGKTGTLKNINALSGYVRTRSGRLLAFSFLHNNYMGGASPYRTEMEKILSWVHTRL